MPLKIAFLPQNQFANSILLEEEPPYQVRPGEMAAVETALAALVAGTRQEPGNLYYQAHRVPDQPGRLHLYEIYRDTEALAAHRATAHFQRYLLGDIVPRLESRQVELMQPLTTIGLPDQLYLPEPPKT